MSPLPPTALIIAILSQIVAAQASEEAFYPAAWLALAACLRSVHDDPPTPEHDIDESPSSTACPGTRYVWETLAASASTAVNWVWVRTSSTSMLLKAPV